MINWPLHLVIELAERRAVVFLGSGISASSSNASGQRSPTWDGLLKKLSEKLPKKDKVPANKMIKSKDFLNAAEIILAKIPSGDFEQIIREVLVSPNFKPSRMHEAIQSIDSKIVITTNYDRIYDKLCATGDAAEAYSIIRYHDSNLVSELRTPKRIIIKAHGCITDIAKLVLSKSSYFKARSQYSNFYSAMDGVFITNTLLFLGYSLSDPDITLLLENANISAPSTNVHYCVMEDNIHEAIIKMFRSAYNIHVLTFPKGKYDILERSLEDLASLILEQREKVFD